VTRLAQTSPRSPRRDQGEAVRSSPYQLKDDPYSSHSVILSLLGAGEGRRLLDAGAADGFLAELLTARGWVVTALERDPVQADRARGRCHEVIVADLAEATSKLPGPFDAIVYGDVLEHLSDPLAVLTSVNQHLAPGGLVIVSVPNVAHLWVRLSLLVGRFDYADRGILDRTHLRFFTRRTFLAILTQAALAVEEFRVTPVPLPLIVPPRLHGGWLRAVHGLSAWTSRRWPGGLAYQFVAACRPGSSSREGTAAWPRGG
jgi:2-polyprenyl-3-methyl-5-hydroxy-6-metoxy-1,4-benzoquinol methylase